MNGITNKETILQEINASQGKSANPCIEYIITRPFGYLKLPFELGNYNTFGHSAVRYTQPDGKDVVCNIEGKEKGKLFIRFYEPSEYFYGTDPERNGSQKGVYQRDFIGIRVENVPVERNA